jgi:hypothetical protein
MANRSKISATISAETQTKLNRFSRARGLKKNDIVEQALLMYMEASSDLPDEPFIPTRLILEDEAFDKVVHQLKQPAGPTKPLRMLMREH